VLGAVRALRREIVSVSPELTDELKVELDGLCGDIQTALAEADGWCVMAIYEGEEPPEDTRTVGESLSKAEAEEFVKIGYYAEERPGATFEVA
jgi:hypothetical protein